MAPSVKNEPRLRLRIKGVAEAEIRRGHPWVFEGSISEQNRPGQMGELAVIYDKADRFLAIGFYDPSSPIRVRILHAGVPAVIDQSWWRTRFSEAAVRRKNLFDPETNGYRCIHGENDGCPGLVLDRYDSTYVLKLYTGAWLPLLGEIVPLLGEIFSPERIVLRLSRNLSKAAAEYNKADGQIISGPELPEPVVFLESGIRFEADVIRGQKTGFFLDQRENRRH